MNYLITGHAGFIGFSVTRKLLRNKKNFIVGIDNFNNYYDINLKLKRNKILKQESTKKRFIFFKCDIRNEAKLKSIFSKYKFDYVLHFAAQAGVRYSLKRPKEYVTTNILGFFNLIELSKNYKVRKFIYASSSSVYGDLKKKSFKETDLTNKPLQVYAASKISNEAFAHAYSYLYNLNTIGLRFFTVYGPWGRPDMAIFKFTKDILNKKKLYLYNSGKNFRDFTYIDDVVSSVEKICLSNQFKKKKFQILNIGNKKSVKTLKLVAIIEKFLLKKAKKVLVKRNKEDSLKTSANSNLAKKIYKIRYKTSLRNGIKNFIDWYKLYFNL